MTKGVAIHVSPESCGRFRKEPDEALTGGVRAGLLSREDTKPRTPTLLSDAGAAPAVASTRVAVGSGAVGEPWRVHKHSAREPGDPVTDPDRWWPGSALRTERERQRWTETGSRTDS